MSLRKFAIVGPGTEGFEQEEELEDEVEAAMVAMVDLRKREDKNKK